jgi:two-component system phosphate regulon response regulator PhoB
MRILVADDLPALRMLARLILTGHEVLEAGAGDEALRLVREHRPDLAILDVNMPGLTGLQVCEQIRLDPVLAGTRVIIVTANNEDDARRAHDAGADHFLGKPFSPQRLGALVQAYVSAAANRIATEQSL